LELATPTISGSRPRAPMIMRRAPTRQRTAPPKAARSPG
jgi:hypothetical protein